MEVVWLKSAVDDLNRLYHFIKQHNPYAAKNAAQKLKAAVLQLQQQPHLGKPAEDLIEYRDLAIPFGQGGYVIRYRLFNQIIHIVHLRHYRENQWS